MAYHRVGEGEFALYGMEKTLAKHVQVDGNCESEGSGSIDASLASCLYRYVGRKVGCQMPWARKPPELQCKTREQYRFKYYVILIVILILH